MHQIFDSKTIRTERSAARRLRATVMNFVAALTVNAAIVLSAPRSTAVNPAPMVLRVKRQLIDGCWHEGEYIGGDRPSVVIAPLGPTSTAPSRSVISMN